MTRDIHSQVLHKVKVKVKHPHDRFLPVSAGQCGAKVEDTKGVTH